MCSVFFGIYLCASSSQTSHHPWTVSRLLLFSSLCLIGARIFYCYLCKDFLSPSVFSFFVLDHSVPIVVEWHPSIFFILLSYLLYPHSTTFVSFAVPIKQEWRFVSSTLFQQLYWVFSISGFPQTTMCVFLLWVFLYRKVRERWVMQVPRCFCAHFFKNFWRFAFQNFSGPEDENISSNPWHR